MRLANRAEPGRGAVTPARRVDDLDRRIIEALQANGRESFRRIATNLGVSEATVRARYENKELQDVSLSGETASMVDIDTRSVEFGRYFTPTEAEHRGAKITPPTLDPRVALELLELARVAAHTRERRFAPLACFMAGVAAERLSNSKPRVDEGAIAEYIQEVRQKLEREGPKDAEW